MTKHRNSVALIVGGSSGMGLETARLLRAREIDLILLSKEEAKLEAAAADLANSGTGQHRNRGRGSLRRVSG